MIVGRNDLMESMLNQCSVEWACWVECKVSRYEELENIDWWGVVMGGGI